MTTMIPGQYLALVCQPMVNGIAGGVLPVPGVVTWTHNADLVPIMGVTLTVDPMNSCNCTLFVPNMTATGGSFTVTATCGALVANTVVMVNIPVPTANGMQIVPGVPA